MFPDFNVTHFHGPRARRKGKKVNTFKTQQLSLVVFFWFLCNSVINCEDYIFGGRKKGLIRT
jgi:hypothetical protein